MRRGGKRGGDFGGGEIPSLDLTTRGGGGGGPPGRGNEASHSSGETSKFMVSGGESSLLDGAPNICNSGKPEPLPEPVAEVEPEPMPGLVSST